MALFISIVVMPFSISAGTDHSVFKYREEIEIPVDTSDPNSRYYPIDLRIYFDHPCWARDEVNRSLRVFVYHEGRYIELESQIYNLNFTDSSHIRSCNVVFLIPDFADGSERYFVFYSDEETSSPYYEDHVSLKEGRFYYEPISGYKADVRYYMIEEDGYTPFLVCYDGSVTGLSFSQRVIKLKEKSRGISLNNWLLAATYALMYLDESKSTGSVSSNERFLSKKVFVDGNLMVKFGIESESADGNIITKNIYTYYYSPISDKRIIVSSYQRVEDKRISTGLGAQGGVIASMITSIIKSTNIKELNTGVFIPYLHFLSEENILKEYRFPRDIGVTYWKWIILPKDDEDLSKEPWISMDFGKDGETFALLFTNNTFLSEGRLGLQISAGVSKWIDMPGLLIQGMGAAVGRNSYEKGEEEILELPSNFETRFVSEFFYTKDGYEKVQDELKMFAKVFSSYDMKERWNDKDNANKETYDLTVIPTLQGLSHPLLATIAKFPVPLVTVELYKDGELVSSTILKRLPIIKLRGIPGRIREIGKYLYPDIKNFSLLQEARFPGMEEGRYTVKVFLRVGKIEKFIGLDVINLDKDKRCVIVCKPEAELEYTIRDQRGNPVEDISLEVIKDGETVEIAHGKGNGVVRIRLPISNYKIRATYKGLEIFSERVRFSEFLPLLRLHREKTIHLYSVEIQLLDMLGFPFEGDVHLDLDGIEPDFYGNHFIFTNIPEGEYTLRIIYKSFEHKEAIRVSEGKRLTLRIPVEYRLKIDVKDLLCVKKVVDVRLTREDKQILCSENLNSLQIPPGKYKLYIFEGDKLIASILLDIQGDTDLAIFVEDSSLTIVIPIIALFLFILSIVFIRRGIEIIFLSICIFLLTISISLPVWELRGNEKGYGVQSIIYLYSPCVFVFKSYKDLNWGESTPLPETVNILFAVVIVLIILDILMIFLHLYLGDRRSGKITFILSMAVSVVAISLLYVLLSLILSASVGGLFGCERLTFEFSGIGEVHIMSAWSLGRGFLLLLLSLCAKILYIFLHKMNSS